MSKQDWKPEDLLGKLVWAWDYTSDDPKGLDILTDINDSPYPYGLSIGGCSRYIRPFMQDENPELFYVAPEIASTSLPSSALSLFPCGTIVTLKLSEYAGIITGIMIRDDHATYGVTYCESGAYKEGWFRDYEFAVKIPTTTIAVGFKGTSNEN
jgi:hypothetical protein